MVATLPPDRAGVKSRTGARETGAGRCVPGACRLLVPALAALVLAACASTSANLPPVRSAHSTASVPAARTPGPAVVDPRSHEQDKDRIKRELATDANVSLAQADVGYYMDVLQGRLNQVATRDIVVGRKADRITVDLSVAAGFEPGSVRVAAGIRDALKPLAEVFAEYRMTMVSLRIRTVDADSPSPRADLGPQRALAVARILASAGVDAGRIVIVGPEAGPGASDNARRDGRTQIEFRLEPIVRPAGG